MSTVCLYYQGCWSPHLCVSPSCFRLTSGLELAFPADCLPLPGAARLSSMQPWVHLQLTQVTHPLPSSHLQHAACARHGKLCRSLSKLVHEQQGLSLRSPSSRPMSKVKRQSKPMLHRIQSFSLALRTHPSSNLQLGQTTQPAGTGSIVATQMKQNQRRPQHHPGTNSRCEMHVGCVQYLAFFLHTCPFCAIADRLHGWDCAAIRLELQLCRS